MLRERHHLQGIVQGVGFRPFVFRLATECGLTGWVRNDAQGVHLEIQGEPSAVDAFRHRFQHERPPLARIDHWHSEPIASEWAEGFHIQESHHGEGATVPISPDIATCQRCLNEQRQEGDRRYRYPFINCTDCGPRFTIVESLPYDRPRTTMRTFPMCDACQREYSDPLNRRFHAQPNACAACGPKIWWLEAAMQSDAAAVVGGENCPQGEEALTCLRKALQQGEIVAVKGIGGFHLVCDAENAQAVSRLRMRKGRGNKPFAVMLPDLQRVAAYAWCSPAEQWALQSPEGPIVLLRKKQGWTNSLIATGDSPTMGDLVSPNNPYLGIMLPYSPLHALMMEFGIPLLMTSGNMADEPIAIDNRMAVDRLGDLADRFLMHDRPIHVACDDSVLRIDGLQAMPLRRARGYAPLPIPLPAMEGLEGSVLALGADVKNAFCWLQNTYAYLSQHLGDMENRETWESLEHTIAHFHRLYPGPVTLVVSDLHPQYQSTRFAREWTERHTESRWMQFQHHHAHLASLAVEHRYRGDQPLVGFCFDGTGFGTDGAIWGGEMLWMQGAEWRRLAHLSYFSLPGGDAGVRHGYRVALAALQSFELPWDPRLPCVEAASAQEKRILSQQFERKLNLVPTSSMGRLFDAVASLLGIAHESQFEGEAAMKLETVAEEYAEQLAKVEPPQATCPLRFEIDLDVGQDEPVQITFRGLLRDLCVGVLQGKDRGLLAYDFHRAIATMIAELSLMFGEPSQEKKVGLTGGVFQNLLLCKLVRDALRQRGVEALTHHFVPPNDGGIALGQAWLGAITLQQSQSEPS